MSLEGTTWSSSLQIQLPWQRSFNGQNLDHYRFYQKGFSVKGLSVVLDDLPELLEKEPNNVSDDVLQITPVIPPIVCNGRIDSPGDSDLWIFKAREGDRLDMDLMASRLGSPLDSVLSILDSNLRQLSSSDDISSKLTDSKLIFPVPRDGLYMARVEDRFKSRGGKEFSYRLVVGQLSTPDFRLSLGTDALTLNRGSEAKLKVDVKRLGGLNGPITLKIDGVPDGVSPSEAKIPEGANTVEVVFKADTSAAIRGSRLKLYGIHDLGNGNVMERVAKATSTPTNENPLDTLLLAVSLPTPFKIVGKFNFHYVPRGTTHLQNTYSIERNGYEGPLKVQLADRQVRHLQGITGPIIEVPTGAATFDYPIYYLHGWKWAVLLVPLL